jgi:hypothetical protein
MLITLGSGSIVFIDASDMVYRNMSTGRVVFRAAAFVRSSASMFLFHSLYSTTKPLKKFSILLTRDRSFSRVGFLAMHFCSICPATTLKSI